MDWKDLHSLLARASSLVGGHVLLKKTVAEILSEVLAVSVSEEAITVKNRVAFLDAHPAFKSEVFLKRPQILQRLQERGVGKQIVDVR